jgi:hypothetical protein
MKCYRCNKIAFASVGGLHCMDYYHAYFPVCKRHFKEHFNREDYGTEPEEEAQVWLNEAKESKPSKKKVRK